MWIRPVPSILLAAGAWSHGAGGVFPLFRSAICARARGRRRGEMRSSPDDEAAGLPPLWGYRQSRRKRCVERWSVA
jgi:hypothetical protein